MNRLNLAWSVSASSPSRGGNMDNPDWKIIEEKLRIVLQSAGSIGLETEDESGKTRSLDVRAENGLYFVTLGLETETDWIVRTYKNPDVKPPGEMVYILGDRWNTQAICHDAATVKAVFQEFFNTGDVSEKYLA